LGIRNAKLFPHRCTRVSMVPPPRSIYIEDTPNSGACQIRAKR
jgi:hypothetical protein